MIAIIIVLLCAALVGYGVFYPHKNAIYKDEENNLVCVNNVHKNTVEITYVEYNEAQDMYFDITNPLNVGLGEFIKSFNLWEFQ